MKCCGLQGCLNEILCRQVMLLRALPKHPLTAKGGDKQGWLLQLLHPRAASHLTTGTQPISKGPKVSDQAGECSCVSAFCLLFPLLYLLSYQSRNPHLDNLTWINIPMFHLFSYQLVQLTRLGPCLFTPFLIICCFIGKGYWPGDLKRADAFLLHSFRLMRQVSIMFFMPTVLEQQAIYLWKDDFILLLSGISSAKLCCSWEKRGKIKRKRRRRKMSTLIESHFKPGNSVVFLIMTNGVPHSCFPSSS